MADHLRWKMQQKSSQRVEEEKILVPRLPPHLRNPIPMSPEIAGVDPFDAFPFKLEPYMQELLYFCEYL